MEKSLDESTSGDTKNKTKEQSWEEIMQAIDTNLRTDVNLCKDKLSELERLVQDFRKPKSSSKDRQNLRQVPLPIISPEYFQQQGEGFLENLQLNYQNIKSPLLKLCLLSFAIFPENSIIKKRSLIYWWIGQGLVQQRRDMTAEQVGEEVYNELLQQDLIELDDSDPSYHTNRCKMNPSVRYMLSWMARQAGFFYFDSADKTPEDLRNFFFSSSRLHLIVGGENSPEHRDLARNEDVFTVFNVNQEYLSLRLRWLSNMRKLMVLQLGQWQHSPMHHIEVYDQRFLDELGVHHKHLKFLSLRGISRITSLPDSIVQLVNLEILDLQACHNLEKLPEDIALLKKLTHLDVSKCYLIEFIPKGTGRLSSLQVLKGFVLGIARKNPCKIKDLRNLTELRRLSIYIGRGFARWDKEFASLKRVASLHSLTISWLVTSLGPQSNLEKNRFLPQQLEKLVLIGIPFQSIPKWLNPHELKNMKNLYIIGGKLARWGNQQQSEQWSVEILRLKHLKKLSIRNEKDMLKEFPRLGSFEMINCADNDILWYKSRCVEKGL